MELGSRDELCGNRAAVFKQTHILQAVRYIYALKRPHPTSLSMHFIIKKEPNFETEPRYERRNPLTIPDS